MLNNQGLNLGSAFALNEPDMDILIGLLDIQTDLGYPLPRTLIGT